MKQIAIGFWMLAVCAMIGCERTDYSSLFEGTKEYKQAHETSAMSYLKRYQTATSLNQVEYGRYSNLPDLYEEGGYRGLIDEAFYEAWDGHDDPQPLGGYLFSDVDADANGAPLDREDRAGLCAYPSKPGESGDHIICVLADPRHFKAEPISAGGFVSHGEEWTFYKAKYEDIGEPVRRWPSDGELGGVFQPYQKRTPAEGLREAQRLKDSVSIQQ